jgi:dolichol-phosphate mannosyltransferase
MIIELLKKYWQKPGIRQFIKFGIVGSSNAVVDFLVYFCISRSSEWWRHNYLLANVASFMIAVTWSFFWNKWWTFKNNQSSAKLHHQYLKFFIVSAGGLGWAELILFITVSSLGWLDLFGKFLAIFLVTFWNFFLNRLWTFKTKID